MKMIQMKYFKSLKNLVLSFLCFFVFVFSSYAQSDNSFNNFKIIDGPHIINDTIYNVNENFDVSKKVNFKKDSILVKVDNVAKDSFYVALNRRSYTPNTNYSMPEKILVISDIEGNYNALHGFLYSNKVIDKNNNWIYGNGHIVLNGDFFDRGKNVTQVLWLIYKIDQQARKNDGQVHFILGNHEILNLRGDYRYNRRKQIKAAQAITGFESRRKALRYLYSNDSELGKWLASKNIIEKIGNYIFVHGGLHPDILKYRLSLRNMNDLARSRIRNKPVSNLFSAQFLFSSKGPLWYRGMVTDWSTYDKINPIDLQLVLNYYKASKIVIGHTFVEYVSSDFDGAVIRTDVKHGKIKFTYRTQGLLIANEKEYVLTANNLRFTLQPL